MPRPLLAFMVAPLAGVCGGALLTSLLFLFSDVVTLTYVPLMIFGGVFFSYPFLAVIGVPVFLLLRRRQITSVWVYLAVGILFGFVGWMVASSPIPSADFHTRALSELLFGLFAGAMGALVFRRIAVGRSEA